MGRFLHFEAGIFAVEALFCQVETIHFVKHPLDDLWKIKPGYY